MDKAFWIKRGMTSWSRNSGTEFMVTAINANICRASHKKDSEIDTIIFFESVPSGRNFPKSVRVIYNVPMKEIEALRDKVEAGNAYLCLDFVGKKLTKVFCYNQDTGE